MTQHECWMMLDEVGITLSWNSRKLQWELYMDGGMLVVHEWAEVEELTLEFTKAVE